MKTATSTSQITIRRATEADLKIIQQFGFELLDFERKNWDPSLDSQWSFSETGAKKYLEAIKEKYTILAEIDNQPVGYLIARIIEPSKYDARHLKQAQIQNIYVSKDARRHGIGTKLFENVRIYCQKEGVSRLDVSVLAKNDNAARFYEKIGFSARSINLSMNL